MRLSSRSSFFYFILQISLSYNKESNCGCSLGIGRPTTKNFINEYKDAANKQQCPRQWINNSNQVTPNEMVLIPGGEYQLGTDDIIIDTDKEGPKRIVKVDSFYIDKYEVSNRDFIDFSDLSGYKTEAETFGDSFVFSLFLNDTFKEQLKDFRVVQAPWWYKVDGVNWKHPYGPDSNIKDLMDHPAVHLSWTDAQTYCAWRGARLPTEVEWEAACRGGHRDTKYPWGDSLYPKKIHMANIWQGTFPHHNSKKDGYLGTNPVNMFPQNEFGLHNMAGNVWEWTQDSWSKDNPKEKVKKGGSYLCHRSYCYRYRCSARSHNTEDSSAGNLGFRCAKGI